MTVSLRTQGKRFFFEKKNQKTFGYWAAAGTTAGL
jgi:hypothetical protein